MIRRGNEILNRLENPQRASATDVEQLPEESSQQAEDTSRNSPPESSAPQTQTDSNSVNVYVKFVC